MCIQKPACRLPFLLFFIVAISISDKAKSQTDGSACDSLYRQALSYFGKQQYRDAIPTLEAALSSCNSDTALTDIDYYTLVASLSYAYFDAALYDSAARTGNTAIRYLEESGQTNHPMYGTLLNRVGYAYSYYGYYQDAAALLEKGTALFKEKYGPASEEYVWFAMELANCYFSMSQFERALQMNIQLRYDISNENGRNNRAYISVTTNGGNCYHRLGRYDSAFALHSESLFLREKLFGKETLAYAMGLSNLAVVLEAQGRIPEAVSYYESSKAIYELNDQKLSEDYGILLTNLGVCYSALEQPDRAFPLLIESVRVLKYLYGMEHLQVATSIGNLAHWFKSFGGVEGCKDAIKFYHTAAEITERIVGQETLNYSVILNNLGGCYSDIGMGDSAIHFLQRALKIRETIGLSETESYAVVLGSLGDAYIEMKDYDAGIQSYKKAAALLERIYGETFPTLSTAFNNTALAYFLKGNADTSDNYFRKAYLLDRNFVLNHTEGLSEAEKDAFASTIRITAFMALNIRTKFSSAPLSNEWLYNASLFYKGLLLEGSKGLIRAFRQLTDPEMQQQAAEYLELKKRIGKELLLPEAKRSAQLTEMTNRATNLERELVMASAEFRNWKAQLGAEWKSIKDKLKDGEAAIEFVSYNQLEEKKFNRNFSYYAALIIRKDFKEPVLVPLFNDETLNKLLSRSTSQEAVVKKLYRSTIGGRKSTASDSLYHLLWKPLLPHLDQISTVYFSADGVINNLNLAAIITPEGKRLIEDYEFVQFSSTRSLLQPSGQPGFKEIQLWGGVRYSDEIGTGSNNRSTPFSYLPGTLEEINGISSIASQSSKPLMKTASDASETEFKKLDGNSPEVLHIATHGFFFPDPGSSIDAMDNRFAQAANPLLRSGLALANANMGWQNDVVLPGNEDGILTAYEIAEMDLSDTRLVVLSACETGLGDIKSGEGVYGLQRAFKMAGVDYLIMSLWQVPDMETREFMELFYSHCLTGKTIRQAFRETQLAMNKKYEPYQWAAFVLVE